MEESSLKGIGKRHDSEPSTSNAPSLSTPRASGGIPIVMRDDNLKYKAFEGASSTIQNSQEY